MNEPLDLNEVVSLGADGWIREEMVWTPDTPFYGVVGDPVGHSLSPVMQGAGLDARELEFEYLALEIKAGRLRALKDGPHGKHLAGFNVTAPHKAAVAKLCDGRTDQARDLGVVNTVKVEDGKWMGHNTDSGGILSVLSGAWGDETPPTEGVVLGAGGSGRAAVDAFLRWGVPSVTVRNRSQGPLDEMAAWLASRDLVAGVTLERLAPGAVPVPSGPSAWICCLAGGVDAAPYLPDAAGSDQALLLDMRYGSQLPPKPHPLGFDFVDGRPVLVMQGGLSFAWWFGAPVPWTALREAVFS